MTKGERIKELRESIGKSQTAFADLIGVSKQTLYKYENDIITNIPSDKIEAIAKETGSTPSYIMGWKESNTDTYYFDPSTAAKSQEVYDKMRVLFDAAQDSKPDDIQMAADLLNRLKGTNPDG